jgi:hypothetical protein
MRRIYFLVPDLESAHKVTEELLLARIEERHIHVIAKEGVELGDLPEASLLQSSDVIPAVERGLAVGGAVLATALVGSGMGAWMSSMIGVDVRNSRISQFEEAIEQGEILFLVDVPKARVEEIEEMVKKHHPDADIEGTEPTIPAFP